MHRTAVDYISRMRCERCVQRRILDKIRQDCTAGRQVESSLLSILLRRRWSRWLLSRPLHTLSSSHHLSTDTSPHTMLIIHCWKSTHLEIYIYLYKCKFRVLRWVCIVYTGWQWRHLLSTVLLPRCGVTLCNVNVIKITSSVVYCCAWN